MRRKISLALIVFALLVLAAACSKKPAAIVNGEKITQSDLDKAVALRLGPQAATMTDSDKQAARAKILQQLIVEKLIVQDAKARGISVSDQEVDSHLARITQSYGKDRLEKELKAAKIGMHTFRHELKVRLLTEKMMDSIVPDGSVTDQDAMNLYKSQPAMFLAPERVNIRLVQVPTLEQADKIDAQMKSGGFDRTAAKYLSSKTVGVGDYSWTPVNIYGPDMEKTLNSLKVGSFGGPYKTHDGYLLISLKGRKPSSTMGFGSVKGQIKAMLLGQKRQQAFRALAAKEKAAANIKILN